MEVQVSRDAYNPVGSLVRETHAARERIEKRQVAVTAALLNTINPISNWVELGLKSTDTVLATQTPFMSRTMIRSSPSLIQSMPWPPDPFPRMN